MESRSVSSAVVVEVLLGLDGDRTSEVDPCCGEDAPDEDCDCERPPQEINTASTETGFIHSRVY